MNIINLIFPKKCAVCGEFTGEAVLCRLCAAKYEQMKREPCKRCGAAHSLCRCRAFQIAGYKKVRARHLFAYEGEMARGLIYKLKRKNLSGLQKFFDSEIAALIKEELRTGEEYIVTYAPRGRKSVREYGFDQAEILARESAKALALPFLRVFSREKGADVEQKTLGAKERKQNAENAFSVCKGMQLEGKVLVIIDDVTTTGSTAKRLCDLAFEEKITGIIFVSAAKV